MFHVRFSNHEPSFQPEILHEPKVNYIERLVDYKGKIVIKKKDTEEKYVYYIYQEEKKKINDIIIINVIIGGQPNDDFCSHGRIPLRTLEGKIVYLI